MPLHIFTGGSQFQDNLDNKVSSHYLNYPDTYKKMWKNGNFTNYVNMDEKQ